MIIHREWVGDEFRHSSPRLLLLGDSHYVTNPAEDSAGLTCRIVAAVRDKTRAIPFYSKAEALCARALGHRSASPFWDRVAFANFVPMSVGTTSDATPTQEMWQAGASR